MRNSSLLLTLFLSGVLLAGCGAKPAANANAANANASNVAADASTSNADADASVARTPQPTPTVAAEGGKQTPPEALVAELYRQHDKKRGPFYQTKDRALVEKYFDKSTADLIWKDAVGSKDQR